MIINNDPLNKMNDYINSVLIPFIVKSFDSIIISRFGGGGGNSFNKITNSLN